MFWNQSKAVNRAAKTIRSFLFENKIELTQAQALDLVGRLQGFPNHMSANAALKEKASQQEVALSTWNDLWQFIATMSEEQRNASINVSEGCDENGNAAFFYATTIVKANSSCIQAASDGVLEKFDHVLLFNNDTETELPLVTTLEDRANRYAHQCELLEAMDFEKARLTFIASPQRALKQVPNLHVGDWVIFHQKHGYFNHDFGFVGDRSSATGWDNESDARYFLQEFCAAIYTSKEDEVNFMVLHCPGDSKSYPMI